jgi:hypothetical protein
MKILSYIIVTTDMGIFKTSPAWNVVLYKNDLHGLPSGLHNKICKLVEWIVYNSPYVIGRSLKLGREHYK